MSALRGRDTWQRCRPAAYEGNVFKRVTHGFIPTQLNYRSLTSSETIASFAHYVIPNAPRSRCMHTVRWPILVGEVLLFTKSM